MGGTVIIRLPKLIGTKKLSPYEQLYALCAKRIGHPIASVSDVIVNKATGEILKKNESAWQWKHWDKKFMGKKCFMDRYFPWHWLNYSPREKEGLPNGKVEVVLKKTTKGN